MLAELARVSRAAREAAGRTQRDIGDAAGVCHAVISNFERGVRWPRKLEAIISAYERRCGLEQDEIWKQAAAAKPDKR